MKFLRNLFDTSKKDVDLLKPSVERINALESTVTDLDDDALKAHCLALKERVMAGASPDEVVHEVFAAVREVSKRTLGMRQFDVQVTGGLVLHQGRIAEMKTGEGKTLVAVAPLVLNALTGRGAHLVTVNDYLARRDAVWMGPIYHFFGLTTGIVQGQSQDSDELGGSFRYEPGANELDDPRYLNLVQCSRRDAYSCDITYGTNHEYGFDYLRDNMAFREEELVMRELHYAIVDEVDSILIDEARTPHIISGPSMEDTSVYVQVDAVMREVAKEQREIMKAVPPNLKPAEKKEYEAEMMYVVDKKSHASTLTEKGMDRLEELLEVDNISSDPRLFHHVNASVKAYGLFEKDTDYVVKGGEVVIVDENTGRMMFGRRFSDGLHQALEAKEGVPVQRESQTVATITFQNLFRLYEKLAGMTGTAKTEEDEFRKIYGLDVVTVPTHRPKAREDHADLIYKTMEAKFRGIGWELLRLYAKQQPVLVGTRSIDMSERVSARLTADLLQRLVIARRLQTMLEVDKSLKGDDAKDARRLVNTELAEMDMQEIKAFLAKINLPSDALSDDWRGWALKAFEIEGETDEFLVEALSHGIPHNILNAKFHEKEALIIAEAGRKGQVTIATNMAGRGVDILLGGRIEDDLVKLARSQVEVAQDGLDEYGDTFVSYRRGGLERAAPPLPLSDQERRERAEEVRALGGLYILGTERHESRRIDNQLRGRAGRQGDPGESRFYVALEDQLWQIFNANMLENPALKAWPPMEEVTAGFLSRMILKTQERIENHFFEARKQVLEYDDVLNAQREHIYAMRREVLLGKDVHGEMREYIDEAIAETVDNAWMVDEDANRSYDHGVLYEDLNEIFPLVDYATLAEVEAMPPGPELVGFLQEKANAAYVAHAREAGGDMTELERYVMLRAVNDKWMEHLQTVDYIREGIGLRGYGQVDPLVAYKRETFDAFQATLKEIRVAAAKTIFHSRVQPRFEDYLGADLLSSLEMHPTMPELTAGEEHRVEDPGALATATAVLAEPGSLPFPEALDPKRVGRNDPCPCGSGLKFKSLPLPAPARRGRDLELVLPPAHAGAGARL